MRHAIRRPDALPTCLGCGYPLKLGDEVRVLQRELAEPPRGDEIRFPAMAYVHLGDEPRSGYRIIGRGRLRDLLTDQQRRAG